MSLILLAAMPMPIIGTVVRYRATYTPKERGTDAATVLPVVAPAIEAQVLVPHTLVDEKREAPIDISANSNPSPVKALEVVSQEALNPPSFMRVFAKVWRTDQFEGLFRGIFPGIVFIFIFARAYISPAPSTFFPTNYTVLPVNFFYFLAMVSTYRVIVSPHRIRLAEPKASFRQIFTEYERSKYLLGLYRYSPAVLPFVAAICIQWFCLKPAQKMLGNVGGLLDPVEGEEWIKSLAHPVGREWARFGLHLLLAAVATLVYTPLDVIITRLAIQPVHAKPVDGPVEQRDLERLGPDAGVAPASVFNFSTEHRPYENMMDCFKRIKDEEGLGALYRVWWLTLLGVWWNFMR